MASTTRPWIGLCCLAALVAGAGPVAALEVELPGADDPLILDLAEVCEPEHRRAIDRVQRELRDQAGVSLLLLTLPALDGERLRPRVESLARRWSEARGDDRGIVVGIATSERLIWVHTDPGIDELIEPGKVRTLSRRYVYPIVARGEFSAAAVRITRELVDAVASSLGLSIASLPAVPSSAPDPGIAPAPPPVGGGVRKGEPEEEPGVLARTGPYLVGAGLMLTAILLGIALAQFLRARRSAGP